MTLYIKGTNAACGSCKSDPCSLYGTVGVGYFGAPFASDECYYTSTPGGGYFLGVSSFWFSDAHHAGVCSAGAGYRFTSLYVYNCIDFDALIADGAWDPDAGDAVIELWVWHSKTGVSATKFTGGKIYHRPDGVLSAGNFGSYYVDDLSLAGITGSPYFRASAYTIDPPNIAPGLPGSPGYGGTPACPAEYSLRRNEFLEPCDTVISEITDSYYNILTVTMTAAGVLSWA